jgi:hypothetical protein
VWIEPALMVIRERSVHTFVRQSRTYFSFVGEDEMRKADFVLSTWREGNDGWDEGVPAVTSRPALCQQGSVYVVSRLARSGTRLSGRQLASGAAPGRSGLLLPAQVA